MDDNQVTSMSEWLKSDVFIIFVVVLLLTLIAIFVVCCVLRRHRTHKKKIAEIEIVPSAGSGKNIKPRFTLKIITEQRHASELIEMLTGQIRSTERPVCFTEPGVSAVTAEVDDTSDGQSEINTVSSCSTEAQSILPTGQQVTSLDTKTPNPNKHLVVAIVHKQDC